MSTPKNSRNANKLTEVRNSLQQIKEKRKENNEVSPKADQDSQQTKSSTISYQTSSQDNSERFIVKENPRELINTIIKLKEARRGCADKIEQLQNIYDNLYEMKRDYECLQQAHEALKQQLQQTNSLIQERASLKEELIRELTQHLKDGLAEDIKKEVIKTIKEDLTKTIIEDLRQSLPQDMLTVIREETATSTINDLRQTLIRELKEDLTQNLKEHFPELPHQHHLNPLISPEEAKTHSYSEAAKRPPVPKPTLILHPKNKIKPTEIKAQLHQFSKQDIGLVNCFNTPTGKVVIQCRNDTGLETLQNLIESTETLKDTLQVTRPQPRKLKLIFFGAPKASQAQNKEHKEDDIELQNYLNDFVLPAISKALQKELPDGHYRLILTMKADTGHSNLVLELPDQDARFLIQKGKILIGFNNCRIQRYLNIVRCFNCQAYHHTANNCKYPTTCGVCGDNHKTGGLRGDPTPLCNKKPNCINCEAELEVEKEEGRHPLPKISFAHMTWEKGRCYAYKKHLDILKSKLDRKPPL